MDTSTVCWSGLDHVEPVLAGFLVLSKVAFPTSLSRRHFLNTQGHESSTLQQAGRSWPLGRGRDQHRSGLVGEVRRRLGEQCEAGNTHLHSTHSAQYTVDTVHTVHTMHSAQYTQYTQCTVHSTQYTPDASLARCRQVLLLVLLRTFRPKSEVRMRA